MQGLYAENYTILIKEIKESLNREKYLLFFHFLLKTTEIYSLIVLEARIWNQGVNRIDSFLEVLWENLLLVFFLALFLVAILGIVWPVDSLLQSMPLCCHTASSSLCVCIQIFFALWRSQTSHWIRIYDYICKDLISCKNHIYRFQG